MPPGADPAALEAWRPSAPTTIAANKSSLKAALALLSTATNYAMGLGDADPSLPVSCRVEEGSVIQALDRLCRASGVSYTWDERGIRLKKEKSREAATTAFGPFLLSGRVVRSTDGKTTSLWLGVDWEPRVNPLLYEVTLEEVTDESGSRIEAKAGESAGVVRNPSIMGRIVLKSDRQERIYFYQDFFALNPALPATGKLKSVRGKIDFFFPDVADRCRERRPCGKGRCGSEFRETFLGLYPK